MKTLADAYAALPELPDGFRWRVTPHHQHERAAVAVQQRRLGVWVRVAELNCDATFRDVQECAVAVYARAYVRAQTRAFWKGAK